MSETEDEVLLWFAVTYEPLLRGEGTTFPVSDGTRSRRPKPKPRQVG